MDRTAFLSSLPFVLPTCLSSWPRSKERSIEVLLKDTFYLSIEPLSKPAYFSGPDDPAMASIQLALDTCKNTQQPQSSGNLLLNCSDLYESLCLLARIHGRIYALDVRQLQSVQLQQEQQQHLAAAAEAHSKKLPASLLLTFSSCSFRLFSNFYDTTDFKFLEQAQKRLTALVQTHSMEVWRRGWHTVVEHHAAPPDSPSTTTTTTTAESRGHYPRESQSSSSATASDDHDYSSPTILRGGNDRNKRSLSQQQQEQSADNDARTRVARRRRYHADCQARVQELQQRLLIKNSLPDETATSATTADLSHLLNAAAEAQGRSYGSLHDLDCHHSSSAQAQQQPQQLLQDVVHEFFPAPRSHSSHHHCNNNTNSVSSSSNNNRTYTAETAQTKMSQLLQEHKRAVKERMRLFLLPSRG